MTVSSKRAVAPYTPLITFANAQITEKNWREVSQPLSDHPGDKMLKEFPEHYGKTARSPLLINGQVIEGPQPVWAVQNELRKDLVRLTDPDQDVVHASEPLGEDFFGPDWPTDQRKRWQTLASQIDQEPRKNLRWVLNKLASVFARNPVKLHIFPDYQNEVDDRLLPTDKVSITPEVSDLRLRVYFQLARLWEDGLLSRLGRCRKCQQFFLAKTSRKTGTAYCSQRCAQNKNPAERTKDSRARRAAWGSIREDLKRAMVLMRTLHQTTERKALVQGEAALKEAEQAFQDAYRRGKGPGYEEGKELLSHASKQVKQLRKKVKGY